jgi:hypothetical protein
LHFYFIYVINDYLMKATPHFRGPSLMLLATVHFVIFVAGLVTASALRHGAHFVTPFSPAEELRAFLALSPPAVRVSNFFLLGSAIPLGIFAVTTVSRLRFMGVRAAGTNIALLGGLIATIALILSGSVGWILSVPEVLASAQIVQGVRWLVVFGMLMALTGEASSLSLVAYPANFFIPITRYLGFIWMFSVAIALSRDRKREQSVSISDAA